MNRNWPSNLVWDDPARAIRALLSFRETVVLAEIPEKKVRKDIETGVLEARRVPVFNDDRIGFLWSDVFALAAVYRNHHMNSRMRKRALEVVGFVGYGNAEPICTISYTPADYNAVWNATTTLYIDDYVLIDVARVCEDVKPRVTLYADGLGRIEEKEGVLGGEAVFKNSRLPVAHVGKMYDRGETLQNILSDYPYLRESDVKFAQLYYKAHPIVGRPRTGVEAADVPFDNR
jgi:uncharacterized protein (DUF433 family)